MEFQGFTLETAASGNEKIAVCAKDIDSPAFLQQLN